MKPLPDCKYCEGRGEIESYHNGDLRDCDCKRMREYDRTAEIERLKTRIHQDSARLVRLEEGNE